MNNNDFNIAITKNLLENKICNSHTWCNYKNKKRYNTCRQWSEMNLALNFKWSSVSEKLLSSNFSKSTEDKLIKYCLKDITDEY